MEYASDNSIMITCFQHVPKFMALSDGKDETPTPLVYDSSVLSSSVLGPGTSKVTRGLPEKKFGMSVTHRRASMIWEQLSMASQWFFSFQIASSAIHEDGLSLFLAAEEDIDSSIR